jgi:hypothetical protein
MGEIASLLFDTTDQGRFVFAVTHLEQMLQDLRRCQGLRRYGAALCDIVSWAEGEGEMIRNRSLLLGVAIGLFGALAVFTVRYVAVVLAG